MIKKTIAVVILLCPALLGAQEDEKDGGTYTLTVDKPESEIIITPSDSLLWYDSPNYIKIEITGKNEINEVEVDNGQAEFLGNGVYKITLESPGSTLITIHELLPNGDVQIGYTKPYTVLEKPKPEVFVCDVKNDSTIDVKHLTTIGKLNAKIPGTQLIPPILGFQMVFPNGTEMDTLTSNGDYLTPAMKQHIYKMEPGRLLYFINIQLQMPDATLYTVPFVQVYLADTDQYSVGYRKDPAVITDE